MLSYEIQVLHIHKHLSLIIFQLCKNWFHAYWRNQYNNHLLSKWSFFLLQAAFQSVEANLTKALQSKGAYSNVVYLWLSHTPYSQDSYIVKDFLKLMQIKVPDYSLLTCSSGLFQTLDSGICFGLEQVWRWISASLLEWLLKFLICAQKCSGLQSKIYPLKVKVAPCSSFPAGTEWWATSFDPPFREFSCKSLREKLTNSFNQNTYFIVKSIHFATYSWFKARPLRKFSDYFLSDLEDKNPFKKSNFWFQ